MKHLTVAMGIGILAGALMLTGARSDLAPE